MGAREAPRAAGLKKLFLQLRNEEWGWGLKIRKGLPVQLRSSVFRKLKRTEGEWRKAPNCINPGSPRSKAKSMRPEHM